MNFNCRSSAKLITPKFIIDPSERSSTLKFLRFLEWQKKVEKNHITQCPLHNFNLKLFYPCLSFRRQCVPRRTRKHQSSRQGLSSTNQSVGTLWLQQARYEFSNKVSSNTQQSLSHYDLVYCTSCVIFQTWFREAHSDPIPSRARHHVGSRYDRNRQDRKWKDARLPAADVQTHPGPAGAGRGRRTHR